jgi:hypothetical protein
VNTRTPASALSLAACLLGACASAHTPREERLNTAFAQIQVHEAGIERERTALAPDAVTNADCGARRAAADDICRHAERICELARELADADALARCAQAQDACSVAQADAAGCAQAPGSPP